MTYDNMSLNRIVKYMNPLVNWNQNQQANNENYFLDMLLRLLANCSWSGLSVNLSKLYTNAPSMVPIIGPNM